MDRIIDMSQAHLIPERIKEYAPKVAEVLEKCPSADGNVQRYYELLCCVEERLSNEPITSPYFAKTLEKENGKIGLEALKAGDPAWVQKRYPNAHFNIYSADRLIYTTWFPFFFTYIFDNDLDQSDSLFSLAEHFGISLGTVNGKIEFPEQSPDALQKDMALRYSEYNAYNTLVIAGKRIEVHDLPYERFHPLLNSQMLSSDDNKPLRPVFMTDNLAAAAELEKGVWSNHLQALLQQFADDLTKDGFTAPGTNEMIDGLFLAMSNSVKSQAHELYDFMNRRNVLLRQLMKVMKNQSFNPSYPLGDVIWVAPVGGYAVPERNDFSVLEGRDIYIFKMNFSNRKSALLELLNVYTCLPPHENVKIRFVLLEKRVSPRPQENHTEILDIDGLFDACDTEGIEPPENLRLEYDQHLRDAGKKRNTSPFIIEPFLRKNSWTLLSGEEGVGKSYIAMALGMAVAAKGNLFWNWRVRYRGNKVLYIADDEMSESILAERMRGLRRMYKKSENFILKQVHAVDLLNGGKDFIEREIANAVMEGDPSKAVNVLILDHLLKLTATLGDQRDHWPEIREWIENLNLRGIAVILLHHEFGGSKMMGSRLIANDAPARIHLERWEDPEPDHLTVGISIQKNKGGKDQRTAKPVTLVIGKTPYWLAQDEKENSFVWKQLSSEERTQKVQDLRSSKHTVGDIARICNVSKSTIEKWITEHLKNQDSKI